MQLEDHSGAEVQILGLSNEFIEGLGKVRKQFAKAHDCTVADAVKFTTSCLVMG
jgi:hypothetical protein